jgi:predicted component of viral defense system (DUF524 family)
VPLTSAAVDLIAPDGSVGGELRIKCRLGRQEDRGLPLLTYLTPEQSCTGAETLALLEDNEYLYEVAGPSAAALSLDPREHFDPDDETSATGRLRPRLYTGVLTIQVSDSGALVGRCDLEVRSRKLDYLEDYRAMLSSIAREGAELLLMRFSPSQIGSLTPDTDADAQTLYQRFAFLRSLLEERSFVAALASIVSRPHESFEVEEEMRPPGRGAPGGSALVRQLTGPGLRVATDTPIGPVEHLPAKLAVGRFAATFDTEPNRFVRMAFETWRATCVSLREALGRERVTSPIERGLREIEAVIDQLDVVLGHPVIRAAGRLTQFPNANQVLQKREGYRDVMRAFVHAEAAARLTWDATEDVFQAGQRNVATLYEYWCYMQLADILGDLCDSGFERTDLFEVSPDGTVLSLRRGDHRALRGEVRRTNRRLVVELWFNRPFNKRGKESWSREMRPDCSILISHGEPYDHRILDHVWLHFDAKYRVERAADIMVVPDDDTDAGPDAERLTSRRSDLLKMHAYRDAIRRSAGAYVLYPGTDVQTNLRPAPEEIVPGIGAFPFRVGSDGRVDSASAVAVRSFLDHILDHVANQATSYERFRYWADRSYSDPPSTIRAQAFLGRPPADTVVLLGYVKSSQHLGWILERRLYNLRADLRTGSVGRDPSLMRADVVVLYGGVLDQPLVCGRIGAPRLLTRDALLDLGYPDPRGSLYCCLGIELLDETALTAETVLTARQWARPNAAVGEPVVLSWTDLDGHPARWREL